MERPDAPSPNKLVELRLLRQLAELSDEGITVAALQEEFGAATRRCLIRLAFGQLVDVHNVVFGAAGYELPEDEPELEAWRWRSPHPLLQRHATPVVVAPKSRVRLSPFGQLLLAQDSTARMKKGSHGPEVARQFLGDLLTAIWKAALRFDSFYRILRESGDEPQRRRESASKCLSRMVRVWHRGIIAFRSSIEAHALRSSDQLKGEDRLQVSGLLKILSKLETHRPDRPLDDFDAFVEAVRVRSSSMTLDLVPVIPDAPVVKKARAKKRKPSEVSLEGRAETLLAKGHLSKRTLAKKLGISPTAAHNLEQWQKSRDRKEFLEDAAKDAMRSKQPPRNPRR
jgi:hypothetical protein